LQFIRLPLPLLRVGRRRFFDLNIWPNFRVFRIQRQPFLKPWVRIGLYGVHRAFRHANTAVNAFVRVDHQHVLTLVETIHGAHLDAVHGFAANAALIDDVSQSCVLSADRSSELSLRSLLAENGRRGERRRLARSVRRIHPFLPVSPAYCRRHSCPTMSARGGNSGRQHNEFDHDGLMLAT